jgi:IclR family acetate operon transcriptional repressor
VESVQAALRVFEKVAQEGPVGVSELARQLGEPKTTVQRCLTSLHQAGWLRPVTVGESKRRQWIITPKVFVLNMQVDTSPQLRRVALPAMELLRERTRETIHLCTRTDNTFVQVEELDSPLPLRTSQPLGFHVPLHVGAAGKAILAWLPKETRDRILSAPLIAFTEKTVTDPGRLKEELATIRKRGFVFDDGQLHEGICGVGAPILDRSGLAVASLTVSCPASRLPEELVEGRARLVRDATRTIAKALSEEG